MFEATNTSFLMLNFNPMSAFRIYFGQNFLGGLVSIFYDTHKQGPDLGFSRGGGGGRIFKKKSKILTTFFFSPTKLIFRALPERCFDPILAKFCAPQANF